MLIFFRCMYFPIAILAMKTSSRAKEHHPKRVDNFLKLNKDTIWTVSTAALQEVDRQQQADKARITELESQLTAVLARLDALENA